MSFLEDFKADGKKLDSGAWIREGEAEFLIKHFSTTESEIFASKKRESLLSEFLLSDDSRKEEDFIVSGHEMLEYAVEMIMSKMLLDWRGIKDCNGNEVEFSDQMARSMLIKSPDFRNWVVEKSNDFASFKLKDQEEAVKKSQTQLSGQEKAT